MPVLKNRAYVSTTTTGTGTITLGSPVSGYQSFADAGVTNGNSVRYTIEDGANFEIGTGTYTASGTTLSRTPSESSNSGSAINLSGSARVFITAAAEDILQPSNNLSDLANAATARTNLGFNTGVDAHLNTSTAANGEFLSWNGSDYDWAAVASGAFDYTRATKTANYTVVAGDLGKIIDVTSNSVTISLTAAATLGDGFYVYIRNSSSTATDVVTIDGNGSETIDGSPLIYLRRFEGIHLVCDGSGFFSLRTRVDGLQTNFAQQSHQLDQPTASGNNSLALGFQTDATNQAAISVGYQTAATGSSSMAFGNNADATGPNSLAVGMGALASDTNSVAIGSGSGSEGPRSQAAGAVAIGRYSKVVGTDGIAGPYSYISGNYGSVAFGVINTGTSYGSQGNYSVSIGQLAKATAANSIAIGDTATSTVANLIALGGTTDTVKISGAYTLPTADGAAGTALVTNGSGALSFSSVGADLYAANPSSATDPTASGANAVAIGTQAEASGTSSIALGFDAVASAALAFAASDGTASGVSSIAIGESAVAGTASSTIAIGRNTDATGTDALAIGSNAQSTGSESVALGQSLASGGGSFAAVIDNNTATYGAQGVNSIAIGYRTKATATSATSIGRFTEATGQESQAIGSYSIATALRSSSFGYQADATHSNSMSLGVNVTSTATDQVNVGGSTQTVRISETYTLPTSDGSANQVLTTNGSGVVTFADAGGDPDLYRDNASSATTPVASGANAVAIGSSAVSSGSGSISIGDGSDATHTYAVALGFLSQATANYSLSLGVASTASGERSVAIGNIGVTAGSTYSTAIGMNSGANGSVTATGSGAMALGGSRASGTDSLAAAIATNSSSYGATGANSIAMGYQAKASSTYATAIGSNTLSSNLGTLALGAQTTASGQYSVAIGRSNIASGNYAAVIGSRDSLASADNSFASGQDAMATIRGQKVHASGKFSNKGDAQGSIFILRSDTYTATPETLTTNNSTASTDNQVILSNNSAYAFHGTIVARLSAGNGTSCAAWKVEGLIRREANAGTTVLVNSATTVLDNTPAWGMALSADTTNGGLAITVTGAAFTSIRWVATIHTSEVTFA